MKSFMSITSSAARPTPSISFLSHISPVKTSAHPTTRTKIKDLLTSCQMAASPKLIRSLSTRMVKVVDKPRPMKSLQQYTKNDEESQVSDVMVTVNNISAVLEQRLFDKIYDKELVSVTDNLLSKLRIYGPRLEQYFEAQLDRAFKQFRNFAHIDDVQDLAVRSNLLQLIELRATQWQPSASATCYYLKNVIANDVAETDVRFIQQSAENLTLSPGELVKSSGKFAIPTRLPGKPYVKDEVVIRNADSGKVMGIKGRRVHMIEELSDTVISFQRVSPGAKERQIQITGSEEDKILIARQLIEDTIKRNASPTRENEKDSVSNGSIYSTSDEGSSGTPYYSFSIRIDGEKLIMIKGRNLEVLNVAKIILEKNLPKEINLYVNERRSENDLEYKDVATATDDKVEANHTSNSTNTGINNFSEESKLKQVSETKERIVDIKPKPAENAYTNVDLKPKESHEKTVKDSDTNERVARTDAAESSNPHDCLPRSEPITWGAPGGVRKDVKISRIRKSEIKALQDMPVVEFKDITTQYSKQFMLDCCSSKASHKKPANWSFICDEFSQIVREEPLNFVAGFLENKNQA